MEKKNNIKSTDSALGSVTVVVFLNLKRFTHILLGGAEYQKFIIALLLINILGTIQIIRVAVFRIEEESRKYALLTAATLTAELILAICFVAALKMGAYGIILAQLLAVAIVGFIFIPWFIDYKNKK